MALIAFVGRLGADPKWNEKTGRDAKCEFTVAEDKKTEELADANWWRVTVWGQPAEFCAHFMTKGRMVYITGTIEQRKHGESTYYNVKAQDVKALDRPHVERTAPAAAEYDPFADTDDEPAEALPV